MARDEERTRGAAGPGLAWAVPLALLLAACAGSPGDYTDVTRLGTTTSTGAGVRAPEDRAAVERELTATADRQSSAGRGAADGLPSAMALAIIRQQQAEEARALLRAAGPPPAAGNAADPVDPAAPCGGAGAAPCPPATDGATE